MAESILDLSKLISAQIKDLSRQGDAIDAISELWAQECPDIKPTFDRISGRGVLTVKLANASQRFMLATMLRGGLEDKTIRVGKGKVKSVKLVP